MLLSKSTKKAINRTLDDIRSVVNSVGKKINGLVLILLKFVGFYIAINTVAGDMNGLYQADGFLTKTVIKLGLAIVCTILPARFGTLLVLGMMCYFMVKVSLFGGIVASLLVLIIFLITVCFTPEYAYLLLLVPFFAQKGWFLLVPIFVGVYATPMAVLGLVFGGIMWAAMEILPSLMSYGATVLDGGSLGDLLEFLPTMVIKTGLEVATAFVENKAIVFYGIVIAAVALIAWIVSKLRINYAPYWAIAVSGLVGMICLIVLRLAFGFPGSIVVIIFGTLGAMLFAALLRLLDVPLDYRFVRNLAFSDDEYYYQVRLTPVSKTYQNSTAALRARKNKKGDKSGSAAVKAEPVKFADETKVMGALTEANTEASANGDTIVMTADDQKTLRSEEKLAQVAREREAEGKADKVAETKKEKKSSKKSSKKTEEKAAPEPEKQKEPKKEKGSKEEAPKKEKTAKKESADTAGAKGNKAADFWEEIKKAAKRSYNKITGKKPEKKAKETPAEEKATEAEVDEILKDF